MSIPPSSGSQPTATTPAPAPTRASSESSSSRGFGLMDRLIIAGTISLLILNFITYLIPRQIRVYVENLQPSGLKELRLQLDFIRETQALALLNCEERRILFDLDPVYVEDRLKHAKEQLSVIWGDFYLDLATAATLGPDQVKHVENEVKTQIKELMEAIDAAPKNQAGTQDPAVGTT